MTKSRLYFQRKLREILEIENPPPLPGDNPEIHNNIVGERLGRFSEKIFWLSIWPKKIDLILSCNLNSKYNLEISYA